MVSYSFSVLKFNKSLSESFRVFQSLSESFRVFQSLSESFRVFQNLSESFRIYQSLSESTRVFQSLSFWLWTWSTEKKMKTKLSAKNLVFLSPLIQQTLNSGEACRKEKRVVFILMDILYINIRLEF